MLQGSRAETLERLLHLMEPGYSLTPGASNHFHYLLPPRLIHRLCYGSICGAVYEGWKLKIGT